MKVEWLDDTLLRVRMGPGRQSLVKLPLEEGSLMLMYGTASGPGPTRSRSCSGTSRSGSA